MLTDKKIIKSLCCPICKSSVKIEKQGAGVLCCNGQKRHSFDFASEGYVNFAPPNVSGGGDSKAAVSARSAFLDTELYSGFADKLCELLKEHLNEGALVADAGCGEGYYSLKIAKEGFSVVGFDLSKFAVSHSAKRAKKSAQDNCFFGVSSVYALPLAEASVDAVVNIFAPCAEEEYKRVLKQGGLLLVLHAGEEHLLGLKNAIYENAHKNDGRADLPKEMTLVKEISLKYKICVNRNDGIKNLFAMTPYYWKTSQSDADKLNRLERLDTEAEMIFSLYRKD